MIKTMKNPEKVNLEQGKVTPFPCLEEGFGNGSG